MEQIAGKNKWEHQTIHEDEHEDDKKVLSS